MVNSSRADTNTPCFISMRSRAGDAEIGQYGTRHVQTKQPYYRHNKKPEAVDQPESMCSKLDLFKDALWSRVVESYDLANKVIDKSADLIDKYHEFVKKSPGSKYCRQKFRKVRDSGRNINVLLCPTEDDGHWLKNAVSGRKYFPGLLVYSTSNAAFCANNKMLVDGMVPMCGDLTVLYAKGLYGPGKKGFSLCPTIKHLQQRMSSLGVESWSWATNRADTPEETHVFHANDFSLALKKLVHRYWDMPFGEKKVFILHTESVKNSNTHAMVIALEKKSEDVMVLRHYDPNWTNSCQKVILNHPDYAGYLGLPDLYRPEDFQHYFKNGVAKLSSLETVKDNSQAAFYWYDQRGSTGLRLAAEEGLWYQSHQSADKDGATDSNASDAIQRLHEAVAEIIVEVVAGNDKTAVEKGAIVEFFLRNIDRGSLGEKISSVIAGGDISPGFKLRCLQDDPSISCRDIFSASVPSQKELLEFDAEELLIAVRLAVRHNDWELAEHIFLAMLSDRCRSEEEKRAVLNVVDLVDCKSEFLRRLFPHIIRSDLSLAFKLDSFKTCFHDCKEELIHSPEGRRSLKQCFSDFREDFERSAWAVSDSLGQGNNSCELSQALELAIYLNDTKLAGNLMDAILNDDQLTEETKVMLLKWNYFSHVGHELVFDNVEVVELYLSKVMASDLGDSKKAELLSMANGTDHRAICWALCSGKTDMVTLFVDYLAGSGLSDQAKFEILQPGNVLDTLDFCNSSDGPFDCQMKSQGEKIRVVMNQLIDRHVQGDFAGTTN